MKNKPNPIILLVLALAITACTSPKKETEEKTLIHQGYSDTADQYEVDGWLISNVDIKAKLWNPRGKSQGLIEARARYLADVYDASRTEEQKDRAKQARKKYTDAIVINGVLPSAVGIIDNKEKDFRKGLKRNIDAGITLVSASVYAFPGDSGSSKFIPVLDRITKSRAVGDELRMVEVKTVEDIRNAKKEGKTALMFNSQGADYCIDDMSMMRQVKNAGLLVSNFVYNNDNALAGGGSAQAYGVTDLGKEFIKACNENGIVVDVSHSSNQTAIDAAGLSSKPVIASHSPSQTLYGINRNLSDEGMKAVAETGGCVCTTGVGLFLNEEGDGSPEAFAKHVVYTANLIGKDKTCFSTDYVHNIYEYYLKFVPNVDVYPPEKGFGSPMSNTNAENVWDVVAILEDEHGWTDEEIRSFLGENLLRVYKANWE